jgi:hypothetical protein
MSLGWPTEPWSSARKNLGVDVSIGAEFANIQPVSAFADAMSK